MKYFEDKADRSKPSGTTLEKVANQEDISKVENSLFVMYRHSYEADIPTFDLDIIHYIRLESLPEDLRNQVREHFGWDPK